MVSDFSWYPDAHSGQRKMSETFKNISSAIKLHPLWAVVVVVVYMSAWSTGSKTTPLQVLSQHGQWVWAGCSLRSACKGRQTLPHIYWQSYKDTEPNNEVFKKSIEHIWCTQHIRSASRLNTMVNANITLFIRKMLLVPLTLIYREKKNIRRATIHF